MKEILCDNSKTGGFLIGQSEFLNTFRTEKFKNPHFFTKSGIYMNENSKKTGIYQKIVKKEVPE